MEFARDSIRIKEQKISKFETDIKSENILRRKIKHFFKNEFEDSIEDILFISQDQFLDKISKGVSLILEDLYTDICLSDKIIKNIMQQELSEIKKLYNTYHTPLNDIVSKANYKQYQSLTNYRRHCICQENYAMHNCKNKHNKLIIISDNKLPKKIILCPSCGKVYFDYLILCKCTKCNTDYYTNILKEDENPKLLLATWENYHCPLIVNEIMKCIKCNENLLINMDNGLLYCSNKKCGYITKPEKILWTCTQCKKEFNSGVRPYNPLEIILVRKVIRQTLLLKQKAHPNNIPCCKLNVFFTDFFHKKICKGILYTGELHENMVIVCEKCRAINFYERFIWTCPKCLKKFRDIIEIKNDDDISKDIKGLAPDIQKNNDDLKDYIKRNSLKAVIDENVPRKRLRSEHCANIYEMLKKRKENIDIDVLANFRKLHINLPKDKYENEDIYEDINNNNTENNIKNKILILGKKNDLIKNYLTPRPTPEPSSPAKLKKYYKNIFISPKKNEQKIPIKLAGQNMRNQVKSPKIVKLENENENEDESVEEEDEEDKKTEEEKKLNRTKKLGTKGKEINEEKKNNNKKNNENNNNNNQIIMKGAPISNINGISENLLNHINKRINAILSKSKLPLFNIDEYFINKKLGEGAYGLILSASKMNDTKEYAIKKIIAKTLNEIASFTKEFELVHLCNHPNIMKIYGISIRILDSTTYSLYVLMEIAKYDWDKEIRTRLRQRKNYTENELIEILRNLCDALLFMQTELKISHRDIKPQNILIFDDGSYKVADFGEAKEVKIHKSVNTLRGTELYMSPALYDGLKHNNNDVVHDPFKSDVFSLGFCFLYAATLNFNLLYEFREIKDDIMRETLLRKCLTKNYSETFYNIICGMLKGDEKERYGFQKLNDVIIENYGKKKK